MEKNNLCLFFVLTFCAFNVSAQKYFTNFREIGPFNASQRSTALHIDIINPQKWYLGTEGGGLWISNNQGQRWQPAMPNHLNIGKVIDIEQDKNSPDNIYYLATSDFFFAYYNGAGVFRSTDGGTTFQQWATPQQISGNSNILGAYDLAVIHSKVFVQTIKGVYQLDNDGTGTLIYIAKDECYRMEVLEKSADEEVVLVVDGNKVYRGSNDTGSFVFDSNPILETTILNPSVFPTPPICIGYSENHPNVVYAVKSDGTLAQEVHRSDDYGESWTLVYNEATEGQFKKHNDLYWIFQEWNDLWVHEDHPDTLILTSSTMFLSFDGGANWYNKKESGGNLFYGDMWPQSFSTNPINNKMVVGHDHGLFEASLTELFKSLGETGYSPVSMDSVVDKSKGVSAFTAYVGDYFPEGDQVVIGGQDRGAWQIYNGEENYLDGGDVYGLVQIEENNIMLFDKHGGGIQGFNAQNGGIRSFRILSNNGGQIINGPDTYSTGNQVDDKNANNHVFYANDFSYDNQYIIWKIQSDGTKTPIYQSNKSIASLSSHADSGNIYFLESDRNENELKRINANTNEVVSVSSISNNIQEIEINQSDETFLYGWSGFFSGSLFEINTLSGQSKNITQSVRNLPWNEELISVFSVNAITPNFLLLGTNLGLYYSSDRGQVWTHEPNIPSTNIFDIDFRKEDNTIFLFTYGRGAWAMTLNDIDSPLSYTPNVYEKGLDFNLYPNPTTEFIKIKLTVTPPEKNPDTFVHIFSPNGKIWLKKEYPSKILETKTRQINISELPDGIHYIQIQNGSHTLVKPFIVNK